MKQKALNSVLLYPVTMAGMALVLAFTLISCSKDQVNTLNYYEVGAKNKPAEWRDSSFVVATSNRNLIQQIEQELLKPVAERKIVNGALVTGSGGYNKNGSHTFNWHFKETDWALSDVSIEIYDGRPYSDVELNPKYWLDTMKRYAPWNSYIKRQIK